MQVLQEGKKMPWTGKELKCVSCKCEFKLENTDQPKAEDDLDPIYYFECPNCKYPVALRLSPKEASPNFGM